MKLSMRLRGAQLLLAALLVLLVAGCVTTPKINWAARVGHYTFDQTVTEIGPPDKQAKLADGSVVAEWITQRSRTHVFAAPSYAYASPYGYGMMSPMYMDTATSPEYYLRLTFGADGQLAGWKRGAR